LTKQGGSFAALYLLYAKEPQSYEKNLKKGKKNGYRPVFAFEVQTRRFA